jgi:hypothetical protein
MSGSKKDSTLEMEYLKISPTIIYKSKPSAIRLISIMEESLMTTMEQCCQDI